MSLEEPAILRWDPRAQKPNQPIGEETFVDEEHGPVVWRKKPGRPKARATAVRQQDANETLAEPAEQPAAPNTVIRISAGELHTATTEAENALIAAGFPIYQRGDFLVQPVTREVPASRGKMTMTAGLGEMNLHSMIDVMSASAIYERFDARSKDWVRINPPTQVANILLSRTGRWNFPTIRGVITTPTLRPDGSLLTAPGYDVATRLYHAADLKLKLHQGVHQPTRQLAESALKALGDLLGEFPFVKMGKDGKELEVAKSVALSAILTAVCRGAMSVSPLHAINAHTAGSGKSYLVDIVSMIATGRPCPVISVAKDNAETEKRIAGCLLAGFPIFSIDNVNGELGGDLLCQAVERPLIEIRCFGVLDMTEVESSSTILSTGNNLRARATSTKPRRR